MRYYLGIDVGGSKTHALIAGEDGKVLGFGKSGPGNHEIVGYEGLRQVLLESSTQALEQSGLSREQISGAGFGIAGYDWPSERAETLEALGVLELNCPISLVNDAVPGLAAGSPAGWGVNLIAGTSNNCYGRDQKGREGRVTGAGVQFGEYGGAYEIILKAIHAVNYAWIRRGPATSLTQALMELSGTNSEDDLMEALAMQRVPLSGEWALQVFEEAAKGDAVAAGVIRWAGTELGELAKAVIRQLSFEKQIFDLVLSGSLFKAGEAIIAPVRETVLALAPKARLIHLNAPPVSGALLLGAEAAGLEREKIYASLMEAVKELEAD